LTLMKLSATPWRVTVLLASSALLLGIPAAVASSTAAAASDGYIALGNLSENPSPVNISLYSAGDSSPQFVQDDVAYGTILDYQAVTAGKYTVDIASSASQSSAGSVNVTVSAGEAYIVAPLQTSSQAGQLHVIDTDLNTPKDKAFVQVVQTDLAQPAVTFHCSCGGPGAAGNLVTDAAPGNVSMQFPIPAGNWTMTATGSTATTSLYVPLSPGQVHTEIVIEGPNGTVQIEDLLDAAGPNVTPVGGVSTGLGGAAPHGPGFPLPWLLVIGAGALVTLVGGLRLGRGRLRRLTARG